MTDETADNKGQSSSETASTAPSDGLLQAGDVIEGKYRIDCLIAGGGMGVVYRAEHISLHRPVALKLLHRHLAQDEEYLRRFKSEARVASTLCHPSIITVHDFGIWQGLPYLVMQLAEGHTLRDELRQRGRLSASETLSIVRQIAAALQEAHLKGIVHRDLKPENIVLAGIQDGQYKLGVLDFGLAKQIGPSADGAALQTQLGMFMGTAAYAAPEQVLQKGITAACDVYTVGIMIYEMLSGVMPFAGGSDMELLLKQVNAPVPALDSIARGSPLAGRLEQVLLRCLKKNPTDRFQDGGQLLAELDRIAQTAEGQTPANIEAHYAKVGAGIIALIVAVILILWSRPHGGKDDQQLHLAAKGEKPPTAAPISQGADSAANTSAAGSASQLSAIPSPASAAQESVHPADVQIPSGSVEHDASATRQSLTRAAASAAVAEASGANTAAPASSPSPPIAAGAGQESHAGKSDAQRGQDQTPGDEPNITAGMRAFDSKHYEEAIPYLQASVNEDPGNTAALLALGLSYENTGNCSKAERPLANALHYLPKNATIWYYLARVRAECGQVGESVETLHQAVRLDPALKVRAAQDDRFANVRSSPDFAALVGIRSSGRKLRSTGYRPRNNNTLNEIEQGVNSLLRQLWY